MLGDEVMAAALIDRLLHHCLIVNTRGNSYRNRIAGAPAVAAERGGEAPRRSRTVTANPAATRGVEGVSCRSIRQGLRASS